MKNLIILLSLVTLLGTSCKKDLVEKNEANKQAAAPAASKTKDLKVASNFEWSTTSEMLVEITPKTSGLFLIQSASAEVFYKVFLKAGEKHSAKILMQNKNEKMYLYFNGSQEEVAVKSGTQVISKLK